ncbi:choice-of-anchor N protein [Desulfonatronovibrio hydrogenovorans]|uniref:choice-of-anchor N protein n=1 Tax=Desulfonatronovibrio hydrogenovorans TaxID=53245 RepID=UPI000491EE1E|nr:choice-of-anchor N protein [Desulfonatronovibrio hydrogenovorans]
MKKLSIFKIIISLCLLLAVVAMPSAAQAVPSLQLYIMGAQYNESTESWMSYDNPFTLLVAGSNSGNAAKLTNLKLHIGIPTSAPDAWSGPSDWFLQPGGTVSIQGPGYESAQTIIFTSSGPHGVPGELPGNGTPEPWPGYYLSLDLPDMDFTTGSNLVSIPNFDPDYDSQDQGSGLGVIYEYIISYQASHLFGVHLDVTAMLHGNNGIIRPVFAPYSHNADAPSIPEPATMLLLGTGLLVLAGFLRNRPFNNKQKE